MRATSTLRQKVPHVHHVQPLTARPRRLPQFVSAWRPATPQQAERPESKHAVPAQAFSRDLWKDRQEALQRTSRRTADSSDGRERAIRRLNDYLSLASTMRAEDQKRKLARKRRDDRKELRARLWKAYSLAKSFDATILAALSPQDWGLLWTSAAIQAGQDQYARAHVEDLYHTMVSAGVPATTQHKIAYLKSIFMRGREKETLEKWNELSGPDPESCRSDPALFECGIWLYADMGDLVGAMQMLDTLFAIHPAWDQGIMMVVFRAHCRSPWRPKHAIAWDLYTRMKNSWTDGEAPQDYDSCFVGFLEAHHYEYAEQVFIETVLAGHLAADASQEEIDKVLKRLFHLYHFTKDLKDVTRLCTLAIAILPKEYSPHIFEHWLRWAAALAAPDSALEVLDAMFKRGCEPSVLHFNLVLAALLRKGDKAHEVTAENIGWHMVEALTRHGTTGIPSTSARQGGVLQSVPPANTATFAHLLSHHAKHDQWEHVDYLVRKFRDEELHPNELIMNVLMDNECRKGNYGKTWEIYTHLVHHPAKGNPVFPNGASFRCLWKTLRLALENPASQEQHNTLPSPRELLAEMVNWFALVHRRYDADTFRLGLAGREALALSKLVLHSFSHMKDLPGSLVALHVLWDRFCFPPPVEALDILQNQIAWVDMSDPQHTSATRQSQNRAFRRTVQQLADIFQVVVEARFKRLGITRMDLGDKDMCEFMLHCLSEFVRVLLVRQHPPEEVEKMIDQAKRDVGLPDLPTGDITAFDVA